MIQPFDTGTPRTRRAALSAIAGGAFALTALRGGAALADPPSKSEVKGAATVTAQQVQEIQSREGDRLRLIDGRKPGQWEKGRIAKAVKIDWRWSNVVKSWQFDAKALGGDKAAPIVVYGQDPQDGYAALVVEKAVAEGYTNVMWLRGGLAEWVAANRPEVS